VTGIDEVEVVEKQRRTAVRAFVDRGVRCTPNGEIDDVTPAKVADPARLDAERISWKEPSWKPKSKFPSASKIVIVTRPSP